MTEFYRLHCRKRRISIHLMDEPDMTFTGFVHAALIALVCCVATTAAGAALFIAWAITPY